MAISDAYASEPEYRGAVKESASEEGIDIRRRLLAISRLVDRKTGYPAGFNRDAAVTSRTYVGGGTRSLWLRHSLASLDDLAVKLDTDGDGVFSDEDELALTDYEPRGLNGDLNPEAGPDPRPWLELWLPPWSTLGYWPEETRVLVTGYHGWPVTPVAIKEAVIQLCAMVELKTAFGTGRVSELDAAVDASPQARRVIKELRDLYSRTPVGIG